MRRRINARAKGIAGELQAIAFVRALGFTTSDRLIQPRGGANDGPDFHILRHGDLAPLASIEVKRDKSVRPWTAGMASAMRQAADTPSPLPTAVLFRRDREPWGMYCELSFGMSWTTAVVAYGDQVGNLLRILVASAGEDRTAASPQRQA